MFIDHYDTFLIDLDDTLYDEKLYLFEAYNQMSLFLSQSQNIQFELINEYLRVTFLNEGRTNLFDKLFDKFKIGNELLADLLEIMRNLNLENKIQLYPQAYALLAQLNESNKKTIVVTNGNSAQQANKFNNIDWKGLRNSFDVIYAKDFGSKPNRGVFQFACKKFNLTNQKIVMIGDSEIDSEFAKNCSIDFIHKEKVYEWVKLK
jgi:putative hydrolase of the HAD superfamily